jgi:phosphopantetheine adenylyltransferase
MKKTQDDYINNLKKDLDRGNNFVDYFAVLGLSTNIIFSDFLYENDLNTLNKTLSAEILSKFPPFDKTTISIDENMIRVIKNIV